jgi:ABC-type bacteriocin/lantibiotic exporter with double-glycine peptidase domain
LLVGVLGWGIAVLIRFVLDRTSDLRLLGFLALATTIVVTLRAALAVARRAVQLRLVRRIEQDLAAHYLRHVVRLDALCREEHPTGDLLQRLQGLEHLRQALEERLLGIPFDVILVLVAAGILAGYSLMLTGFALLATLLPAVVVSFVRGSIRRSFEETERRKSVLGQDCVGAFQGARDLLVCGGEDWVVGRLQGSYALVQESRMRHLLKLSLIGNGTALLSTLASILILFSGAKLIHAGTLTQGGLMFVFTMAGIMLGPLEQLAISWIFVEDAAVTLRRHGEILSLPAEPRGEGSGRIDFSGSLRLESVTFGYESGRSVLSDVTLDIPNGSSLALVGESGAGKSTLLAVLAGLYAPDRGQVLVDGRDLRMIPLHLWRKEIGVVFQGPNLFEGTVEENIRLGCTEATLEDVQRAARLASAEEFILNLPQGYDTKLSAERIKLSAGQTQRIAIARALVRNPRLLLLDEATSNLDVSTEGAFWTALSHAAGKRTTFFVTHRLSSSAHADRIAVLDGGRIVEFGTFSELMAMQGRYAELWRRQSPPAGAPAKEDAASGFAALGASDSSTV